MSALGHKEDFAKPGGLPIELEDVLAKAMVATRRAKLESVMADIGEKVGTNEGKENVPEDCAEEPETTLTALVTMGDAE